MKKSLKIVYAAAAAVFLAGAAGSVLLLNAPDTHRVEVVRDGEVLYRFDLKTSEDQSIRIEYGDSYNVIEILEGKIRVSEAGCPDKTCVKMGWLKSGTPVVCLPNRLEVRFAEGSGGIDAVVG